MRGERGIFHRIQESVTKSVEFIKENTIKPITYIRHLREEIGSLMVISKTAGHVAGITAIIAGAFALAGHHNFEIISPIILGACAITVGAAGANRILNPRG